jgi:hypothetical protein
MRAHFFEYLSSFRFPIVLGRLERSKTALEIHIRIAQQLFPRNFVELVIWRGNQADPASDAELFLRPFNPPGSFRGGVVKNLINFRRTYVRGAYEQW